MEKNADNRYAGVDFYPRPPRGGRHFAVPRRIGAFGISIHALREEGDGLFRGRGASSCGISIHALREEGDDNNRPQTFVAEISIHALREEGDTPDRRQ